MGIIIDIVAVLVILICAAIAYLRGFVKTFFGFISMILAIVLACVFCKQLATSIKQNTQVDEWISENIILISASTTNNEENEATEEINKGENVEVSGDTKSTINISNAINNLPDTLNEAIGLHEIKKNATQTIATKITDVVISIFSWIIIYGITRIVLAIITVIFNGIMNLPLLKEINNIAGLVIGIIMGFFRIYFVLAIVYFISNIINISGLVNIIGTSTMVASMYNNNLLINLIFI